MRLIRAGAAGHRRDTARALRLIEGDAAAEPLEALFALAVARAASTGRNIPGDPGAGDPGAGDPAAGER